MPILSDLDLGTPDTTSKPRILGISGSSSTNIFSLDGSKSLSSAHEVVLSSPRIAKAMRLYCKILSVPSLGCMLANGERDREIEGEMSLMEVY